MKYYNAMAKKSAENSKVTKVSGKSVKAKKNPGGRPSKYKEEYCDLLIQEMGRGYSYEAFAGIIGVADVTLYEWEKVHPEFSRAKKEAFQKSRVFWETLGIDNIINKTDSESYGSGAERC